MARILLIDADSKKDFPNLALMKISAHMKNYNYDVDLLKGIPENDILEEYDRVYISCIFYQNKDQVLHLAKQFDNVEIGGTGVRLDLELPDTIEHIMPDYSLYDIDYSIGFTSRGCVRDCSWCVVSEKEGRIRDHADITEFHHPDHKKIILLDNNILSAPSHRDTFEYLIDNKLRVNFNSGFDIRLINEDNALLIKDTKIRDWRFKGTKYTFAFDQPSHKRAVTKGIDLLRDTGINLHRDNCIFYVLVGYNTTVEEDIERINFLISKGVGPFVMRYNQTVGPSRILLHLSRWVNRKYYQFMSFDEYDYSDSKKCYAEYFSRGCPQRSFQN